MLSPLNVFRPSASLVANTNKSNMGLKPTFLRWRHAQAERCCCVQPAIFIFITGVAVTLVATLTSWGLLPPPITGAAPPGRSGLAGVIVPAVRHPPSINSPDAASHGGRRVESQVTPANAEPSCPFVAAPASAVGDSDLSQRSGSVGATFEWRGWGLR